MCQSHYCGQAKQQARTGRERERDSETLRERVLSDSRSGRKAVEAKENVALNWDRKLQGKNKRLRELFGKADEATAV